MSSYLSDLPFEILSSIVAHVDIARTLLHLSLSCKRLHDYIEKDGFRVFVQNRFPSVQPPPPWKDAAHALTSLSHAWDRKAFQAKSIQPPHHVVQLPRGRKSLYHRQSSRPQTMGYQSVIDSYEEQIKEDWTSRREVLVWGAGAELIMRLTDKGEEAEIKRQRASSSRSYRSGRKGFTLQFDRSHHQTRWISYKESWETDGRGDITSIKLLRPLQRYSNDAEQVIIGRANGSLDRVALSASRVTSNIITRYSTNGRFVRSVSLSSTSDPILAACLSSNTIALYPTRSSTQNTAPDQEISVLSDERSSKVWSTQFLTPERLAVGLGRTKEPIHIYEIASNGINDIPLRKFGLADTDTESSSDIGILSTAQTTGGASVYPIVPVSPASQAGSATGTTFLSGWYNGSIRYASSLLPQSLHCSFTT